MAELFGKKTGLCRGQGGSMHMFDRENGLLGGFAFIGEGIPIGLGAAFQSKYRVDVLHEDGPYGVTASFFGDGTCNVGQFYECLNMAALYKLPHIFVVENNKWAIGMSHARSTSSTAGDEYPYIYKKGPAFGMPSVYVDGMDVVKVREVALEAVERARRGDGPTLIEAETYRFRGHSLADPDELRSKEEKAAYQVHPLPQHTSAPGSASQRAEAWHRLRAFLHIPVSLIVRWYSAVQSPVPVKTQLSGQFALCVCGCISQALSAARGKPACGLRRPRSLMQRSAASSMCAGGVPGVRRRACASSK